MIVDSHCHLDMLAEHDSTDNIIKRAIESDVHYLQTICTRLDGFEKILNIAKKYTNVFASVGVHPSEVEEVTPAEILVQLSTDKKVIGLGETGLDYFYNKELVHQQLQRDSFHQHLIAAQENNLPVIIHTRDAEADTYNILAENKKYKEFPGLIHCFTASKEFASKVLDLGMYISISGIVTFKNAENIREALNYVPIERILVETDSPYLAPVPKRGKTNEPAYTRYVVEYLSELKGISVEKMAQQTTDNFFQLFSKAQKNLEI
ncbi:MAG: TatD family hydrolase [Rickettsiaceae bacterium]|nr:TatD family hydrolase [Rickettsiaceae bacterium]MDP4832682.1 TatD family hydrolase [Rickettsiaceae bacterium]MDP5082979.1 TatD family hydrolase [Rickettsiaceae bacterium]